MPPLRPCLVAAALMLTSAASAPSVLAQRDPDRPSNPVVKPRTSHAVTPSSHRTSSSGTTRKPVASSSPESSRTTVVKETPAPTVSVADQVEEALDEGNKARDAKQYDQAETEYRKALRLNPKEARAYLGLGNTYFDRNRYQDAIGAYQIAINT